MRSYTASIDASTLGGAVEQTTIDRTGLDVTVGKRTIHVEEAGRGEPVVVLHHSTGPFWTPFYDRLAGAHRVVAPDLPGYLRSDRPEMARHPRDLAIGVSQLAAAMDLGPFHLVGFGLGGWVAAELATMAPAQLVSLTLVGADGIRPTSGEIADTMLISHTDQGKLGFSTDQAFVEVFGDAGRHARSAVGNVMLPHQISVEIEGIVAVKP